MQVALENRMKAVVEFPRSVFKKNNRAEEVELQDYELRNNMRT
jgi:hypothetical protein